MHGGLGYWKFYITEVDRIESQHSGKLPPSRYTMEEIQAGFKNLAESYGSYSTLVYMEEKTGLGMKELLTWSVYEYNHRLEYYAWQAHTQKNYQDIMNRKANRKK